MDITSEQLGSRQIRLTIVVSEDRLMTARETVAREMSRREKIPGYRPGKVPYERMVALVGTEVIDEQALEIATRGAVEAAVKSEGLRPSAPISLDIVKRSPLTITSIVPLQPEVDLGDYHSIRVPEPEPIEIDDEMVESTIENWRSELSYLAPVDRPAEAGDVLTLRLVGRLADAVVYEDESLALALNPEAATDAGLPVAVIDNFIGLAQGQEARFEVQYSEFWPQSELQGQTVAFEAVVASVASITLPEMNNALAEQLADVETLEELRDKVRQTMRQRLDINQRDGRIDSVVDALVAAASIDYPPALLEAQVIEILGDLRKRVEQQGFLWERWLELQKEQEGEIVAHAEAEAKQRLERRLVLTRFAQLENIMVSRKEVDQEIAAFSSMLSTAARRGLPGKNELRDSMGSRMLSSRVLGRLIAITSGSAEAEGTLESAALDSTEGDRTNYSAEVDAPNASEETNISESGMSDTDVPN